MEFQSWIETAEVSNVERCLRRQGAAMRLLRMHFEASVGHIGGNLSCLDIMLVAHHDAMNVGDQFVLSKGHAAGALYITLWTKGLISDRGLQQFHGGNGTKLSGHPPSGGIPGIPFATGSLGHGLGLSAGLALARRFRGDGSQVICLTSDGEWNEGSNWESLIFCRQQMLQNLIIIVDENGLQGFGRTKDVADLSPLANKFREFGLLTVEVDGHDQRSMAEAMKLSHAQGPLMIVAKTTKGRGVSFMENEMKWHYLPMTQDQYRQACEELGAE